MDDARDNLLEIIIVPCSRGKGREQKAFISPISERPRFGSLWLDRKITGWREVVNFATLHCTDSENIPNRLHGSEFSPVFHTYSIVTS